METTERRKYPRKRIIDHPCMLTIGMDRYAGQLVNISRAGICITTARPANYTSLHKQAHIYLKTKDIAHITGIVRHTDEGKIGIELDLLDCGKEAWRKLCQR